MAMNFFEYVQVAILNIVILYNTSLRFTVSFGRGSVNYQLNKSQKYSKKKKRERERVSDRQ